MGQHQEAQEKKARASEISLLSQIAKDLHQIMLSEARSSRIMWLTACLQADKISGDDFMTQMMTIGKELGFKLTDIPPDEIET